MCSLLLVCAVLKTLHFVKCILNAEECRSVGKSRVRWRDELSVVLAVKEAGVLHETMEVLEEYKKQTWYGITAEKITSKLCCISHFVQTVGRVAFSTKLPYLHLFLLPSAVTVYQHTL